MIDYFNKLTDMECEIECALGTKDFLEALLRAIDAETELELLEYIKRCYDID